MPKLEPMSNGSARMGGRRARGRRVSSSLAEINVVPLVDVMMVLLVIFMVAAPMLQQGISVNLPKSNQSKSISSPITVTVPTKFRSERRVQIGKEWVGLDVLPERIRQELSARNVKNAIVASDTSVTIGDVLLVADKLGEGGVEQTNFQTQPALVSDQ
jgi:biopolymer transport protein ExbD